MTQLSIRQGGSLLAADDRAEDAIRLAGIAKNAAPGRVRDLSIGGINLVSDRLSIARAASYAGEA